MHGPWHPILHNLARPPKVQTATSDSCPPDSFNDYTWYRPLNSARKEIRLLYLEPEPIDSTKAVVAHVFNASLLDANVPRLYGCLSYCWGNAEITKPIHVMYTEKADTEADNRVTSGTDFNVTTNLEAALRVFRSKLARPVIWADAICIDQSDIAERNSQVALMAEIYTQAVQTIIWLGDADVTTKPVFDFADFITKMEVKPHEVDPSTTAAGINCHRLRPLAKGEVEFTATEASSDDFYKMRWGIQALLARPFFRRAWVLQEVGLADREQIVVHCGEHSLWWSTLQNLFSLEWRASAFQGHLPIDLMRDKRLGLPTNNPSMLPGADHTLPEIWSYLRRYCSSTKRGNIIDLIFRRLDIQATDSRDHLIALFGLAAECQLQVDTLPGFRADYAKSVAEVYTLFTRAVIETLQNTIVLSAKNVFTQDKPNHRPSLPSWVPDYSSNMNLRRTLGYLGIGYYKASGSTKPKVLHTDNHILSLSGYIIDQVSSGPDWGPFQLHVQTKNVKSTAEPTWLHADTHADGIRFLWRIVSSRIASSPISKQDLLETFILTLICCRRTYFDRATITSVADIPGLLSDFAAYWKLVCGHVSDLPAQTSLYDSLASLRGLAESGDAGSFGQRMYYTCHERCFLVTERGLLALVPPATQSGDMVVVCEGANVPYVVRKTNAVGLVEFIGECYVHGVMRGSTMVEMETGSRKSEVLHFV
ncbi:hypothetical protein ACN47E_009353 [Coniothyrium glycines]